MKINLKRINDDYLFKATNDRGHEIISEIISQHIKDKLK